MLSLLGIDTGREGRDPNRNLLDICRTDGSIGVRALGAKCDTKLLLIGHGIVGVPKVN